MIIGFFAGVVVTGLIAFVAGSIICEDRATYAYMDGYCDAEALYVFGNDNGYEEDTPDEMP